MKKMYWGSAPCCLCPRLATGDGRRILRFRAAKAGRCNGGDEFRPNLYIPQADALPILKVRLKDIEQTDQGRIVRLSIHRSDGL